MRRTPEFTRISTRQVTHRGFTLIEVLVVVAVIGLLLSILVPSLNNAREQARSVKCLAHLRQLAHGMTMYLQEYGAYPAHQWRVGPDGDTRIRWFTAMARLLGGFEVQNCPALPDWDIGRNNSYGYNYKYLGSARENTVGPKAPYESFPVKSVRQPSRTIAFGDSDGTGWTKPHVNGVKDVDMLGNHGYTLDPTFIPRYSEHTLSGGKPERYASHEYRSYVGPRHLKRSNLVFADGHAEPMRVDQIYIDNRYWNGLGGENPARDDHVDYGYCDGQWRFPEIFGGTDPPSCRGG